MGTFDKSCAAGVIGLTGLGVVTSGSVDQVKIGIIILAVAVVLAIIPEHWFSKPFK